MLLQVKGGNCCCYRLRGGRREFATSAIVLLHGVFLVYVLKISFYVLNCVAYTFSCHI